METSEVSKTPIEDAWNQYAPMLAGVPPVYVAQLKSMFQAGAVMVCQQIVQIDKLPENDSRGTFMLGHLLEEAAGIIKRTVETERSALAALAALQDAIAAAIAAKAAADGKAGTN